MPITRIAVSPDNKLLITGSQVGVLNFYEMPSYQLSKSLFNLTMKISCLAIHNSSELLTYCSSESNRALRLVHLQTGRVFANWPKDNSPLFKVRSVAFDSGSFMAVGNSKGSVLLFGLCHYQ